MVDGLAPDTFDEAATMLALVMTGLRVPLVIAVNRCENRTVARSVADALGAGADIPAIPCQLIDPESGREVVAEVLVALLESTDLALAAPGGAA